MHDRRPARIQPSFGILQVIAIRRNELLVLIQKQARIEQRIQKSTQLGCRYELRDAIA